MFFYEKNGKMYNIKIEFCYLTILDFTILRFCYLTFVVLPFIFFLIDVKILSNSQRFNGFLQK
jgi:hypothetical protein